MPISILYFLASTSLSLVDIGLALSIASGLQLPFAPMLGGLVDKIGARRILLAANVVQAVGIRRLCLRGLLRLRAWPPRRSSNSARRPSGGRSAQ
ncbi:MAG: hypothetical protein WKF82_06400 [Nocardioidaceae bacterium]